MACQASPAILKSQEINPHWLYLPRKLRCVASSSKRRSGVVKCVSQDAAVPTKSSRINELAATYTHLGTNTFTLQFSSGAKILVDPWLVGNLTFGGLTWLLESKKYLPADINAVLENVDAILLSQSLDDHTHRPTLEALPKTLPIVAETVAAEIATDLGFKSVTALDHGEQFNIPGKLSIKALPGALVGPPWSKRQNGWLLRAPIPGSGKEVCIYTEAHSSNDQGALNALGKVDAAIIPTQSSYVAGYPVVEGVESALNIVKTLKPNTLIPLYNSDGSYSGAAATVITSVGTSMAKPVQKWLEGEGILETKVLVPDSYGNPLDIYV